MTENPFHNRFSIGKVFAPERLARIRIVSGLILFVYVTTHLLNHSLGLISVNAMEWGGAIFKGFWRFPLASLVLYAALAAHFSSVMIRLHQRRTLRMPLREWLQLLLGLAIPLLLVSHVMGTRYVHEVYGINDSYTYMLLSTFYFEPIAAVQDAFGLVAAWGHGIIGLHMWAKLKPWYSDRLFHAGLVLATLIPVLALAGYLAGGREIIPLATDGEFMGAYYQNLGVTSDSVWALIGRDGEIAKWIVISLISAFILARVVRELLANSRKEIEITYLDGPMVRQPIGASLLEMSKLGNVPHASICGGRGRCSTCRVRVTKGLTSFDPGSDAEVKVLSRIGAADDVRLACQIYPKSNVEVLRLLPPDTTITSAEKIQPWSTGREQPVTVMFADLRNFTQTSESRLPFDVVYLINQFSRSMGEVVEAHNGRIDKFLGDGFMALFGVEGSAEDAANKAVEAAGAMLVELETLNTKLAGELTNPLRMGIGLHSGSVILGDMGYGVSRGLTAIGDVVNTASRLEAATKDHNCALGVSSHTVELAGLEFCKDLSQNIVIRGKKERLDVFFADHLDEFSIDADKSISIKQETKSEPSNE